MDLKDKNELTFISVDFKEIFARFSLFTCLTFGLLEDRNVIPCLEAYFSNEQQIPTCLHRSNVFDKDNIPAHYFQVL